MSGPIKVWAKFLGKNRAGNVLNLRIVEIAHYQNEDVIDLFVNYFMKEETILKASGVSNNPKAIEEMRGIITDKWKAGAMNTMICCLDNDDDKINEIIGASYMMLMTTKDIEEETLPQTEELKKSFEIFGYMKTLYDEDKELKYVDRYFAGRGIVVHPDYRGFGIAQEFLKVRRMICKEHRVPINGAWMTSYGTQRAAERDGWETVYEISYSELEKKFNVTFENGPPSCKFMITRIPL